MGILVCLLSKPVYLVPLLGGMMLGNFNLWILMLSANRPRPKLQFMFSLTKVAIFAYLIVLLGNFTSSNVLIVICGFLSYKLGLWMEYIVQGAKTFPAFRQARPGRTIPGVTETLQDTP